MYEENGKGPKIEPRGTPHDIIAGKELTETVKLSETKFKALPETQLPKCSRTIVSTLSKAAGRLRESVNYTITASAAWKKVIK